MLNTLKVMTKLSNLINMNKKTRTEQLRV